MIAAVLRGSPRAAAPFRAWLSDAFTRGFGGAMALVDLVVPAIRMGHSTDVAISLLRAGVADGWLVRCEKEDRGTMLPRMRKAGYAVCVDLCYGYLPVREREADVRGFLAGPEASA